MNNWIKTSERLPEYFKEILFIVPGVEVSRRCGIGTASWNQTELVFLDVANQEAFFDYQVPYWMPYPELPEEEGGGV